MSSSKRLFLSLLLLLLMSGCSAPGLPQVEVTDEAPPVAVSEAATLSFIQKSAAAANSATSSGQFTLTITQEELTSFLHLQEQLTERVLALQEGQQIPELAQIPELQEIPELQGVPGLDSLLDLERLRNLEFAPRLKDPDVRFTGDGHIIARGRAEWAGRGQPVRVVVAPRASSGELELDFVEGRLGPVPVPEQLFDALGGLLARAILLGQPYAEITEIRVDEGALTVSGRRNQ